MKVFLDFFYILSKVALIEWRIPVVVGLALEPMKLMARKVLNLGCWG